MVACERPRWIALTHRRQAHLGRLIAMHCVRKIDLQMDYTPPWWKGYVKVLVGNSVDSSRSRRLGELRNPYWSTHRYSMCEDYVDIRKVNYSDCGYSSKQRLWSRCSSTWFHWSSFVWDYGSMSKLPSAPLANENWPSNTYCSKFNHNEVIYRCLLLIYLMMCRYPRLMSSEVSEIR